MMTETRLSVYTAAVTLSNVKEFSLYESSETDAVLVKGDGIDVPLL